MIVIIVSKRKCAEAEPELAVQLDVFDEQRDSDDAQSLQGPHGVDLNSPLDVFYAILKQVSAWVSYALALDSGVLCGVELKNTSTSTCFKYTGCFTTYPKNFKG